MRAGVEGTGNACHGHVYLETALKCSFFSAMQWNTRTHPIIQGNCNKLLLSAYGHGQDISV